MTHDQIQPGHRNRLLPALSHISSVELERILKDHETWSKSSGQVGHPARFFNVQLADANFDNRCLIGARFELCDLTGASFHGCQINLARFHSSDLSHASFEEASGLKSIFLSIVAKNISFARAKMDSAHYFFADLTAADFSGACLRQADLGAAELVRARFSGADLRGANLSDCGLDPDQLVESLTDNLTRLPTSFGGIGVPLRR